MLLIVVCSRRRIVFVMGEEITLNDLCYVQYNQKLIAVNQLSGRRIIGNRFFYDFYERSTIVEQMLVKKSTSAFFLLLFFFSVGKARNMLINIGMT